VQAKIRRLCLIEDGAVDSVPSSSPSSTTLSDLGFASEKTLPQLPLPSLVSAKELPTVEEVLMKLAGALANLEQPGLNRSETARFKTLVQAVEKYEKLYVDYARYKALDGRLIELEEKYFDLVKKQQKAQNDESS
jgi:hypothetical protein